MWIREKFDFALIFGLVILVAIVNAIFFGIIAIPFLGPGLVIGWYLKVETQVSGWIALIFCIVLVLIGVRYYIRTMARMGNAAVMKVEEREEN